jgi:hypothetical protein
LRTSLRRRSTPKLTGRKSSSSSIMWLLSDAN